MTTNPQVVSHRPLAGTGRIGIVSGYFQLCGIGSALQGLWLAAATVFPRQGVLIGPRPYALIAGLALMSFGFFRTSRLLDQRRRSGARLVVLSVLAALPGLFIGYTPGLVDLGISLAGLGLVASVWKHLEKD